ncbi:TetR/AcrR family transcriptional regulator [Candidatus Gracilibacteria bacterium]|nr:TetR/AcrR family transcriptional regulator [Candidatus Gracilibacteria bacterium]
MPSMSEPSAAREHVLRVAEELFSERGYTAVTLKDIAERLGVRQAALYYHVPQGKEQLFVEVMQRSFRRHQKGIERALAEAEPRLAVQLTAVASINAQPPLGLARLARSDLPALTSDHRADLSDLGQRALITPLERALAEAYARGETRLLDTQVTTALFLAMIDSIHEIYQAKAISREVLARDTVEMLTQGLLRR